jgi:hypothetical protein
MPCTSALVRSLYQLPPPINYPSVGGVSLHSFTREGSPTIAYCPICPFIEVEGGMILLQMVNQSPDRHAAFALRVQFRYNPCLNKGVRGAAMAGCGGESGKARPGMNLSEAQARCIHKIAILD